MEAGQPRQARQRLKTLRAAHPGHQRLLLLLASAYWAEGNRVWAARVLAQAAERHPASCQVRSFLVWLLLQQAELDRARELLVKPGCPDGGAMNTRWAGAGWSLFREQVRTRTELDGGLAVHGAIGRLRLLGGAALRGHWSAGDAYDLAGGVVLGSATYPVGPITARARALVSYDAYLDSEGYFAADSPRHDWLLKGTVEAWSPAWHGLRVGLTYDLSNRFSTADTYAYTDHRPMLRLSYSIDWDPWAPSTAQVPQDHVRLPVTAGSQQSLEDERIQDILRREDAARRGSSCVN